MEIKYNQETGDLYCDIDRDELINNIKRKPKNPLSYPKEPTYIRAWFMGLRFYKIICLPKLISHNGCDFKDDPVITADKIIKEKNGIFIIQTKEERENAN